MFTRQAWEGGIQQAIDKAASSRREEIDWVLSDSRKTMSTDLSPEALKARLTRRYFTDFAGSWLNFSTVCDSTRRPPLPMLPTSSR